MDLRCSFQVNATLIDNDFIDRYMVSANGEYVKVYLYVLRHQQEFLEISVIAEALHHTEADVRRALLYWEQLGALRMELPAKDTEDRTLDAVKKAAGSGYERMPSSAESGYGRTPSAVESGYGRTSAAAESGYGRTSAAAESGYGRTSATAGSGYDKATAGGEMAAAKVQQAREQSAQGTSRPLYSQDQVNRLQGDEDFVQLLYIAQKYLNKIFTARECEVFAYLYEGLHMPAELLEYLVEYCVQNGHTSIRYIEAVALNWHEKGFTEVEDAKAYAGTYTKDVFAVMRAFGLNDRKPGDVEMEMIGRWFQEYGFTREVVLEACHRTIDTTHNPSFRYADKILSEWRRAGVRSVSDIAVLDERRQKEQRQKQAQAGAKKQANQFHNFEQRDTDYDSMVLEQVRTWISNS